jgi:hypothetical protein
MVYKLSNVFKQITRSFGDYAFTMASSRQRYQRRLDFIFVSRAHAVGAVRMRPTPNRLDEWTGCDY